MTAIPKRKFSFLVAAVGVLITAQTLLAQQQPPPQPPPPPPPHTQQGQRFRVEQFQIEPNRLRWWQENVPFFEPGYVPFRGEAPLGGMPFGALPPPSDTIVRRAEPEVNVTVPIPIEIVQLDLRSVSPIEVKIPPPPKTEPPPKPAPEPEKLDKLLEQLDKADAAEARKILDLVEKEIRALWEFLK